MWKEWTKKRWFRPAFTGILFLLELLLLWFVLRGAWPGEPGQYELLATVNVTGLSDLLANCEATGADPLYPLLLRLMLRLLPEHAGHLAAPLLQMGLLALLWWLLLGLGRRLLRGDAAILPPVLFCASMSCIRALSRPEPTLLLLVIGCALALFYHAHLQRPVRTWSGIGLFLLYLAGILTDFGCFFVSLACVVPYAVTAGLRRRSSDAATAAVMLPAALLTALVLHPALVARIAALFARGRLADGAWWAGVQTLFSGVSRRLFGGGLLIAAIGCVLLLLAVGVLDAMRPKERTETHADADPSHAAYQRRINRRKAVLPRRVTLTRAQVSSLLMLCACGLALLIVPLGTAGAAMQALDSYWILLLLGTLHYAVPKLFPRRGLTLPVSILVCAALTVLSI